MKKLVLSLMALVIATGVVFAAESYTVSGTAPLTLAIDKTNGRLVADTTIYSAVSNSTLTINRPHEKTTAAFAASSSTTLTIYTASSNTTAAGYSPTIGTDSVIVLDTGSNGYQLRVLSAAPSFEGTTNTTTYTLASAVTCAANSPVYFVESTYNVSLPVIATLSGVQLGPTWAGYKQMPVYMTLPGVAGASSVSGQFHVEE